MIKNFIYVEDGSIDVGELEKCLDETTKVIVYRRGTNSPQLVQPGVPVNTGLDGEILKLREKLNRIGDKVELALGRLTNGPIWLYRLLNEIRDEVKG